MVAAQLVPAGEQTALRSQCLSAPGAQFHAAKELAQSTQKAPQNHELLLPLAGGITSEKVIPPKLGAIAELQI